MNQVIADRLNSILKNLTKAMQFFDETCKEFDTPLQRGWVVSPTDYINTWQFRYEEGFKDINKTLLIGGLTAKFKPSLGSLYFLIDMPNHDARLLICDVLDGRSFIVELSKALLEYKKITPKTYYELRDRVPTMEKVDQIAQALDMWTRGLAYKRAKNAAQTLERLRPYIPEKFYKAPTTLYRAMLVATKAFEELRKGQPLVLKHRMYSSWTTSPTSALRFGYNRRRENYVVVVIKVMLPEEQIMLNVEKLGLYLVDQGKFRSPTMLKEEKEVIVKNPYKPLHVRSRQCLQIHGRSRAMEKVKENKSR